MKENLAPRSFADGISSGGTPHTSWHS